jgi:CheY-like chemotaxis protein
MQKPLRHVLCIDDDEDIREIVAMCLGATSNIRTTFRHSGNEALQSFPQQRPDLILLDVQMPGLSGPETYRALQNIEASKGIPIVFVTASAGFGETGELLALGAIGVIPKPLDPMMLADDLLRLWQGAQRTGEQPE